jgi:hypothetical protein
MTTVDLKAKAISKYTTISITIDPKYADAVPQITSKDFLQRPSKNIEEEYLKNGN